MNTPYEVEAIIGRRVFSGKVLYLAKWKDFPLQDATWESVKVLKPYRHLIKLYNEQHRNEGNHTLSDNQQDLPPKLQQQNFPVSKESIRTPEFEIDNQREMPSECLKSNQRQNCWQNRVPRKRGRPKKSLTESKQQSTRDEKYAHEAWGLLVKRPEAEIPKHFDNQPGQQVEIEKKEATKSEKTEYKNGLQKIYLITQEIEGQAEYIVEDKSGHLSKLNSIQMLRLYPEALVQYLERTIFTRFTHHLPYF